MNPGMPQGNPAATGGAQGNSHLLRATREAQVANQMANNARTRRFQGAAGLHDALATTAAGLNTTTHEGRTARKFLADEDMQAPGRTDVTAKHAQWVNAKHRALILEEAGMGKYARDLAALLGF